MEMEREPHKKAIFKHSFEMPFEWRNASGPNGMSAREPRVLF